MQLSNSLTPRSISSSGYLLRQYGGAAAAYSLQRLDTSTENVVRAREGVGDTEADFTAEEVSGGALREFALQNDADLIRFADQASATDKRMYFDGVDDEVTGVSIPFNVGDTLKFSLTLTSTPKYVVSGPLTFHRIIMSTAAFQITVSGATSSLGISVSEGLHDVELVRTSGNVDVYIDGNLEGSVSPADTAVTYTSIGGKSGQSSGTGLYRGVIYDVESLTGGVSNALYNGYGNTNGDWEDQIGSNDGTVVGSPALFSGQGFDAFVTTWYDQSGNGRNATQATAASQPQIVADGVVVTDANGFACVDHDGTNDGLATTSGGIVFDSIIMVGEADVTTLVTLLGNDSANLKYSLFSDGAISYCNHSSSIQYAEAVDASPAIYSTLGTDGSMRKGGVEKQTGTVGTVTGNALIGYRLASGAFNRGWNGKISEIIIYPDDRSSSIAAIEANIAARYGITI